MLNDVDRGNKLKGAWGQRAMDKVMAEQGYVRVGGHSADDAAAKGVDGIYRKVDPGIHPEWPEYIVGEAKFVSKEKRIDPGVQLEQWYLETRAFVREKPALVQELYEKGYGRVISRILPDGSVKVATFEGFVPPKPT